ncbi:MAG TPA: hypothetical protein VF613_03075 [Longimicrobium sp.]|jgi:hypothetical protein
MKRIVLNTVAFAAIIAGASRLHAGDPEAPTKLVCCEATFGSSCCGFTYCSAGLFSCAYL